jgi:hypothetical protein
MCWPHVNPVPSGAVGKDCQRRLLRRPRFVRAVAPRIIIIIILLAGRGYNSVCWTVVALNLPPAAVIGDVILDCRAASLYYKCTKQFRCIWRIPNFSFLWNLTPCSSLIKWMVLNTHHTSEWCANLGVQLRNKTTCFSTASLFNLLCWLYLSFTFV